MESIVFRLVFGFILTILAFSCVKRANIYVFVKRPGKKLRGEISHTVYLTPLSTLDISPELLWNVKGEFWAVLGVPGYKRYLDTV